jgi:hypothetical protein
MIRSDTNGTHDRMIVPIPAEVLILLTEAMRGRTVETVGIMLAPQLATPQRICCCEHMLE